MSNEFEYIANPTSIPSAVSTGYQAQNINLLAARIGLDLSVVVGGTGKVTVKQAGPVDVNGVLYSCKEDTNLTLSSSGWYYIVLEGSGNKLTPKLRPVIANYAYFNAVRNAHYTVSAEYRILDWLIYYDGSTSTAYKRGFDHPEMWITSSTTWVSPWTQIYDIYITGRGGNGGTGGRGQLDSAPRSMGTFGGVSGSTGNLKIYISAGASWTSTFSATNSSSNYAQFTDNSTMLRAGNLGGVVSGCDISIPGGGGAYAGTGGTLAADGYGMPGSAGGASHYGAGGNGGNGGFNGNAYGGAGGPGGSGTAYGSGGGGGGGGWSRQAGGSGGSGAQGVIRIIM